MVLPTVKIGFTGCPATTRRRFHLLYTFDHLRGLEPVGQSADLFFNPPQMGGL